MRVVNAHCATPDLHAQVNGMGIGTNAVQCWVSVNLAVEAQLTSPNPTCSAGRAAPWRGCAKQQNAAFHTAGSFV